MSSQEFHGFIAMMKICERNDYDTWEESILSFICNNAIKTLRYFDYMVC